MENWTIKRLVQVGFGTVAMVFALLAIIALQSVGQFQSLSEEIDRSNKFLLLTENIGATMMQVVALNRAFLFSGTMDMKTRRDKAIKKLEASIAEAERLAWNNLQHKTSLAQLRESIAVRAQALDLIDNLRLRDGVEGVTRIIGKGAPADDQFQNVLQQIRLEEVRLLGKRQEEAQSSLRLAQVAGALLLTFLAAFLITIYLLIQRNIKRDATRDALEKSEAMLRQILSLLPVGVFVTDRTGKPILINPEAHAIWGTDPNSENKGFSYPAWRLDTGERMSPHEYSVTRALRNGEIRRLDELEIERADGVRRIIRDSAMPLRDKRNRTIGAIIVNMDVTDLKRAEQALRAAHDALEARVTMRTRELVVANEQLRAQIEERRRAEEALQHTQYIFTRAQRIAHIGSWEHDAQAGELRWSEEIYRICGLRPEQPPSLSLLFDVIHLDDRERVATMIDRVLQTGEESKITFRIVRPDGALRHVLSQSATVTGPDRKSIVVGALMDITEQVQAEETLRQLAAHHEQVKEEERKRIAREIHDEMGQNLMALRIDVSMLHSRTGGTHPRLHRKAETMLNNIDQAIKSVRGIINNLRPVVLDLGLYAAVQWQVTQFQRRTNLQCELFAEQEDLDRGLTEAQTMALFRVLQESLTNVARHANAHSVRVSLHRSDGWLTLKIADDGIGIYPGNRRKPNTFGLLGMRERISNLGGKLSVDSKLGEGTVLTLSIPLQQPTAATSGEMLSQQA